ncbi:MAG: ABC transporter ATP-binding protein [Acidimicrobiales bacterium]|nr:ABC transporter ATP-binding protein [Acidimicrobiales bacterium]
MAGGADQAGPWRALIRAARRDRRQLVLVGVTLFVATALPLTSPLLLRRFVDQAAGATPLSDMTLTAFAFLGVAIASQLATIVSTYAGSAWSWRTTNDLREEVATHALGLDYSFHGRHTAGEMIERVDGDIVGLAEFLSQFVTGALGSAMLLIGALVLVSFQDVRLGVAYGAIALFGLVVLLRGQRSIVPLAAAEREAFAQLFGGIEEYLAGAEDIRANGAGHHILGRFHDTAVAQFRAAFRSQRWGALLLGSTSLFFALGTVGLLGLGVVLHDRGAITLGTVVALFQYSQLVRNPIEQIVGQAKHLQDAAASAGRVANLLGEQPTITEVAQPTPLPARPLGVALRNVTFAYADDPPVLRDVTLVVAAGRTLGLVGRSGSGKTTIGRLVLRLYDTTEGTVEVGGVDVRQARMAELRANVRAVTQEVQLFSATLRDNVTLFDDAVDDQRVLAVLHDVGLGAWLASLPDGLATVLGPSGVGMSAGEAQLLALSRVFLADPAVIVLDEPSSRLDPATERLVEAATTRLLQGRTAIVIAHRLAALAAVDDIAVIEGGCVVEHGARDVLAADPASAFARLLDPARSEP